MTGNRKYNLALIGAGRMGSRWAKIISESPRAALACVVDTDIRQAKRVAEDHGAPYSSRVEDALTSGIAAVFIATPHAYLFPLAKRALLAGKHVFVEKPGARTVKEMRELLRLAAQKKRVLMVGFNYRFFDSLQKAKRLIGRGAIGDVTMVRLRHGHPGRRGYEKEWRMNKALAGGGVLMDQGLHVIDLARWFLDDTVVETRGLLCNRTWRSAVEDTAAVLMRTKKNRLALLEVSAAESMPIFECAIEGTRGVVCVPGLGRKYGNGRSILLGRLNQKTGKLRRQRIPCNPEYDRALTEELNVFLQALRHNRFFSNGDDAVAALTIIGNIYAQS